MIKSILVNQKEVPVPVPLGDLSQVYSWVEQTLLPEGSVITKFECEHGDILAMNAAKRKRKRTHTGLKIELYIDSAESITTEVLDAMRDLASAVSRRMEFFAYKAYKGRFADCQDEFAATLDDLAMVNDLLAHVADIIDRSHQDAAGVIALTDLLGFAKERILDAIERQDYQTLAVVLLKSLDPLLRDIAGEIDQMQIRLVTSATPVGEE